MVTRKSDIKSLNLFLKPVGDEVHSDLLRVFNSQPENERERGWVGQLMISAYQLLRREGRERKLSRPPLLHSSSSSSSSVSKENATLQLLRNQSTRHTSGTYM